MNKYSRWYQDIIDNATGRVLAGYKERHHIVPSSLGGPDDETNLVYLTAREHFICHWLLTKMYDGVAKSKMTYALNGMKRNNQFNKRYETAITARVYDRLKTEFSKVHSETMKGRPACNKGVPASDEQRRKNSLAAKGRKRSTEAIEKSANAIRGRARTQETKDKIAAALKGKSKRPMSNHLKEQISNKMTGTPKRDGMGSRLSETIAKQLAEGTHHSQIRLVCLHCGVEASKSRYSGYHGDKCKKKPLP